MLDLKKLEEKLDSALAQETEQSLSNWLNFKRNQRIFKTLGVGQFESKKSFEGQFHISWGVYSVPKKSENINTVSSVNILLAA